MNACLVPNRAHLGGITIIATDANMQMVIHRHLKKINSHEKATVGN
jgi:hypothetical protein